MLAAAIAAIAFSAGGGSAGSVIIRADGKIWREVPLQTGTDARVVYDADGRHNVIHIEHGGAWMEEANCPDGLCVKQGIIKNNNSIIVCVPNRISVSLSKGGGSGEDGNSSGGSGEDGGGSEGGSGGDAATVDVIVGYAREK